MTARVAGPMHGADRSACHKWALLVGINKYRYAGAPLFPRLRGCVHDVADMRATLIGRYEFAPSRIAVLTDAEATRQGILAAIRSELVDRAAPGDVALLYFSGHGSECFAPGRINNRDQTLVPFDGRDRDDTIADLSGADLNAAMRNLRTPPILIVDACFSGSLRARRTGVVRGLPPITPIPPSPALPSPAARSLAAPPRLAPGADYVLLAASAPDEESGEMKIDGRSRGIFTHALCRELRGAAADSTYRDIMDRVAPVVSSHWSSQHPSLEGSASDGYVFTSGAAPRRFYVLASPHAHGQVRLEAGGELGLTAGSTFSVFPPGTHAFDGAVAPTAIVRIDEVKGLTSLATVVHGAVVEPASRAVETTHVYEQPRVRVSLRASGSPAAWPRMREDLAAIASIEIVPEHDDGHDGHDGLEDHGDRDAVDLRLIVDDAGIELGRSGAAACAARTAFGDHTAATVTRWLTQWARWFRVLWLSSGPHTPAIDFTVALHRPAPGAPAVVTCTVNNRTDEAWYLTLLNLSDDGAIRLVFPVGDASLLAAHRTLERVFELEPIADGRPDRDEVVKLFATRMRRDFSLFETDVVRQARPGLDSFDRMLHAVANGGGRGETPAAIRDWTAINRHFSYGAAAVAAV